MLPRILIAILLAATLLSSALARDAAVTIHNRSAWDIYQLFLSSTDDYSWGDDQLGKHIIESGDRFKLHGIPCDDYDVRIVDEDGDVCIIGGVSLCGDRETWVITDADLLACQLLTDE
jgi:hypothetical protein